MPFTERKIYKLFLLDHLNGSPILLCGVNRSDQMNFRKNNNNRSANKGARFEKKKKEGKKS